MITDTLIKESNRQEVVTKLVKLLADEFVLYAKTKNAHWNIDVLFYEKHKYFKFQFEQLDEIRFLIADAISIDDLSEDEIVIRNYMVGELKSLILRNYELTGEIPDFISKYQKKNTHRID